MEFKEAVTNFLKNKDGSSIPKANDRWGKQKTTDRNMVIDCIYVS